MEAKKVFLVISEKQERITIRHKSKKVIYKDYCKTCGKKVDWLTFEEVMSLTEKTSEEIRHKCETGCFDFQINNRGEILICTNSIFRMV